MGASTRHDPREVRAESILDRYCDGGLPRLGSYAVCKHGKHHRVGIPEVFREHIGIDKSWSTGIYADFENGLLILDFQDGDEYDPDEASI